MAKLVFKAAAWDDGDYIISCRPDWEKTWRAVPLGGCISSREAEIISKWLNNGGYSEIERIFKNGYEQPEAK